MALTSLSPTRRRKSPDDRLSLLDRVKRAGATYRQRQALRRLDDNALADIGLSRSDAQREANRPLWDAPETWQR